MEGISLAELGSYLGYIAVIIGSAGSVWLAHRNKAKSGEKATVPEERRPSANELRSRFDEFHTRFDNVSSQLRTLQLTFDENIVLFRKRLTLIEQSLIDLSHIVEEIKEYKEE